MATYRSISHQTEVTISVDLLKCLDSQGESAESSPSNPENPKSRYPFVDETDEADDISDSEGFDFNKAALASIIWVYRPDADGDGLRGRVIAVSGAMLPISSAPESSPGSPPMEEEGEAPFSKKKNRRRIRKKDARTDKRMADSNPYPNQKAMANRVQQRYDMGNYTWAKYRFPESFDNSPFAGAPGITPERVASLQEKPVYVLPAAHDNHSPQLHEVESATVVGSSSSILAFRGFGSSTTYIVLRHLEEAIKLVDTIPPQYQRSDTRGPFPCHMFGFHRGSSKIPIMNAHYNKHKDLAHKLSLILQPVVEHYEGVFRRRAWGMYRYYRSIQTQIMKRSINVVHLWGVWPMLCINRRKALSIPHFDPHDFKLGWCVICCKGRYNFATMAYLCIDIGDRIIAFVLPPGIPLFIPSALFLHFNTWVTEQEGERDAFIFWLPGDVAQWVELGFTTFKYFKETNSPEAMKELAIRLEEFWEQTIAQYPIDTLWD